MIDVLTFTRRDGPPPPRPAHVGCLDFAEWLGRTPVAPDLSGLVPIQRVQPGDTQVGLFTTRDQTLGLAAPLELDVLVEFPEVESTSAVGPRSCARRCRMSASSWCRAPTPRR